ncbi:MAG: methyltransferase domain-containing protein [Marinicaulis sp.]|nr:methyltransferase domain-containing protein [Marinicaulis sp.]
MRTDILDYYNFYQTPLGRMTERFVGAQLRDAWGDGANLSIAGFGYPNPYLELFNAARRRISLSPGAQGVIRWPNGADNCACLTHEYEWPLPDASLDRVLLIHGLEESSAPEKLLREIWRVLADDGLLIVVASHRRGLWSMIDTTPLAAGRPYLRGQLNGLLQASMFRAREKSAALFFPPVRMNLLLRAAPSWERAGARIWPSLSGVIMIEAEKDMMAPVGLVRQRGVRDLKPAIAAPRPATRAGRVRSQ